MSVVGPEEDNVNQHEEGAVGQQEEAPSASRSAPSARTRTSKPPSTFFGTLFKEAGADPINVPIY